MSGENPPASFARPSVFHANRPVLSTESGEELIRPELQFDAGKGKEGSTSELSYVRLPVFEGPLDLLLYLIRKDELDIYDIPIEKITSRYLEYLQLIKMIDLDVVGDYLVVAATLIYIKSRMLLPERERQPEDEVEEDDPRWELVRQLVEYKKFKEVAAELQRAYSEEEKRFARGSDIKPDWGADGSIPFAQVSLFDLLSVFQKILDRSQEEEDLRDIFEDRFTVSDKIQMIRDLLEKQEKLVFEDLFAAHATRTEVVVTFLAVLELIRLRVMAVVQTEAFAPIELARMEKVAKSEEKTEIIEPA